MNKAFLVLAISSFTAATAIASESATPELMPEPIKTEFFVGGGLDTTRLKLSFPH